MEDWNSTIARGNEYYASGAIHEAESFYRKAIDLADELLQNWFDSEKSIEANVVSCHNFVHLLIRQQRPNEAKRQLRCLTEKLQESLARATPNSKRFNALQNALALNECAIDNNFREDRHGR